MSNTAAAAVLEDIESGFQNTFVITQNVRDEVAVDGTTYGYVSALCRELSKGGQRLVAKYTPTQGIGLYHDGDLIVGPNHAISKRFTDETGLGPLLAHARLSPEELRGRIRPPIEALPPFYRMLRSSLGPAILVIDGAEFLLPHDPGPEARDRNLLDLFMQWSRDKGIRDARSGVVLVYPRRGEIPTPLLRDDQGFQLLKEAYPTTDERTTFLQNLGLGPSDASQMANLTTGLRRNDLREVICRDFGEKEIVAKKRRLIEARAGDTVEFIDSKYGLDQANGQPQVRTYLRELVKIIRSDRKSPLVPTGVLFTGVPGNGKSHLARAFAHDCRMNMLRLKNVRGRYIGDSERNLEAVLDLLPSLAPCVVFMDEIDQLMGRRSEGGDNDSGVERRLLGRLLEYMGDSNNRGEILWIGATNRPDLLDVAIPRRFERTFSFMNPTQPARILLIEEICVRERIGLEPNFDSAKAASAMEGYSCDDLEKIVKKAYEFAVRRSGAYDRTTPITVRDVQQAAALYRPNVDRRKFDLIALLSVRAVNFLCDLPWFDEMGNLIEPLPPLLGPYFRNGDFDYLAIDQEIERLKGQVGVR